MNPGRRRAFVRSTGDEHGMVTAETAVVLPVLLLVLAGAVAVFPAARRAARTDPLAALRSE